MLAFDAPLKMYSDAIMSRSQGALRIIRVHNSSCIIVLIDGFQVLAVFGSVLRLFILSCRLCQCSHFVYLVK